MNIVIVMSGGVGARFGGMLPKQYNLIAGRPVIDYVLDAVDQSKMTDRVVIVMDQQWVNYSIKIVSSDYDIAPNGATRLESLYNGMRLIKDRYACEKIVVVDAVGPFLYGGLIDDYFDKLDTYDAVITAQKITGGFTDIYDNNLDREKYIITQSPEGFRFELLWKHFRMDFPYQETAGMLPAGSKRFYNYDFKDNLKLTYDFELAYAEFLLTRLGMMDKRQNAAFFDKELLLTEGLRSFLLRNEREKTLQWIDMIYNSLPQLIARWKITSFLPNQISRYGLVLEAKSREYGNVILKFIPDFVGRFERELEAIRILPTSYMCRLIDADEGCNCMLLECIKPARFACFEENLKLTELFTHAIGDAVRYTDEMELKFIPLYFKELKGKLARADLMPYCREQIEPVLRDAIILYEERFSSAQLYVLHGDLHEQNILDNGQRFYGIDPNGMLAPLELECVRFIRNDVRNHPAFGFAERFDVLLHSFARFVDIHKLVDMFIIDMAFCTYNSVFENEDSQETFVDLELIRIAKEWKEKNE